MARQPTRGQNKSDNKTVLVILLAKKKGQKMEKMKVEDPSKAL